MPGSAAFRATSVGLLALAVVASLWGAMAAGLILVGQLAVFCFFLLSVAALVAAMLYLERDLLHMGMAGALVGFAAWSTAGGALSVLAGVLTGVLVGDAIRDGRSAGLLRNYDAPPISWWCRVRSEPAWRRWLTWPVALAALLLLLPVGITWAVLSVPADQRWGMIDDVYLQCQAAETHVPSLVALVTESLVRVWYVYALLAVAAVACWRLRQGESSEVFRDRQLSRIALAHSLAWLMLSGGAVWTLIGALEGSTMHDDRALFRQSCAALMSALRDAQAPLALMLLTLLFLGRHLTRFLWRHGWMLALALVVAAAVGLGFVNALYVFQRFG